ncbi:BamA/TamA family outer membrane protein [Elizabethkingia argentiflava]|uniref:BamA/TamA family outer membrane protein n=1 Tax=Elizabethkingia argenteiflava TaxID=2681556 RepID=A0A845PU16_9FLAO|nr:BamA/TamA family outer membrane protein [Elizabethkingia argenteiflava]NAW51135.1 BamA/TamA family outer membrane protein [Elizabethkingia argenteiflava]
MGKHSSKYVQKYYLFSATAIVFLLLYACSTRKVPEGSYLLTANKFKYKDNKLFQDKVPDFVHQKPNKKTLFLAPIGLWIYNMANPKMDTILNEYMTYPSHMRTQKLRDSLSLKYNQSDLVGKNMFWNRVFHNLGQAPVIINQDATEKSAERIRKFFVYKGYWDTRVWGKNQLNTKRKKATALYKIEHKQPTLIKDYYYNIPEKPIRELYEKSFDKSFIKTGKILDQEELEKEVSRITEIMRSEGYYNFNNSNEELFFTADTLKSRKEVPLTLEFKRDSMKPPYVVNKLSAVKVYISDTPLNLDSIKSEEYERLRNINFYNPEKKYNNKALWNAVLLKEGEQYNQREIELTKRNLAGMNNFNINDFRIKQEQDSLLTTQISLIPLPKYDFKIATDIHYSQILNLGFSPSVELTSRNIFGSAENLSTSFSGVMGTTYNAKKPNSYFNAYELSAQVALNIPRLLIPVKYYKIPKKYTPTTSILLGTSIQNNIGLGRISFNTGLNYNAIINDIITHRLTLFNTQLNFTRNKGEYYTLFPKDDEYRNSIFNAYFAQNWGIRDQFYAGELSEDDVSRMIIRDSDFQNSISAQENPIFNNFQQSLLNKERQTQDVLISSIIYNFTYNEIGNKAYSNPSYFNLKFETAGNFLSLVDKKFKSFISGIAGERTEKGFLDVPYSQFIKFDVDMRKYFIFPHNRTSLIFRQFIGVGIPYGNSHVMPYMRSYFNGGSNDIRAWLAFGGLGPADILVDKNVRSYMLDNVKITSNIEYRFPLSKMIEGALFTDAGNIWSLKNTGIGDEFKFDKFYKQLGIGSGFGFRFNIAYVTLRLDLAYKIYDPNRPEGERWNFNRIKPLQPTFNFAFGYPF